jgi:endonuclease/exonuclease/phosphatase family metal-dependent hydrolase
MRGEALSLRVMTWNMLTGGQDEGDVSRLNHITSVIKDFDPDILLLQEANGFESSSNELLHRLESCLSRQGFLAVANSKYHLAAFISGDLDVEDFSVDVEHYFHALLKLRIRLADGRPLHVFGVHLCPHSPEIRLAEATHLASLVRRDQFTIVAGDLNSLDSYSNPTAALAHMPADYRARYTLSDLEGVPDSRPADLLSSVGLKDIAYSMGVARYTIPTRLPVFGCGFGRRRLDYVFATEPVACLAEKLQVVETRQTDACSDHYPVVVDFAVESALQPRA